MSLISYSHGDTRALLHVAEELDVINVINQHIPKNKHKQKDNNFMNKRESEENTGKRVITADMLNAGYHKRFATDTPKRA